VFLRRYVLCDVLGKPPAAAADVKVTLSDEQTTREEVTALTANQPCTSCHTKFINPLGFSTENFDGLGRIRTEQILFDDQGKITTKRPVDTSVIPHVKPDDETTAQGSADVMRLALQSRKVEACLTRNYFRYAFGRFEDTTLDGCSLEPMRKRLDDGGHFVDM